MKTHVATIWFWSFLESTCSSEMFVDFRRATRHFTAKGRNFHNRRCVNLKCYTFRFYLLCIPCLVLGGGRRRLAMFESKVQMRTVWSKGEDVNGFRRELRAGNVELHSFHYSPSTRPRRMRTWRRFMWAEYIAVVRWDHKSVENFSY